MHHAPSSVSPACEVTLRRVAHQMRDYGGGLQPPADRRALTALCHRGVDELQVLMPRDYLAFLHRTDGLDWDGVTVFASSAAPIRGHRDRWIGGCVEMNLLAREARQPIPGLVLAEAGDEQGIYDARARRFAVCDRVSRDVLESFPTFDHLLRAVLRHR